MKARIIFSVLILFVLLSLPGEAFAKKNLSFIPAKLVEARYIKEEIGKTYRTRGQSKYLENKNRYQEVTRERIDYNYYYLFRIEVNGQVYDTRHRALFTTGKLVSNWVIGDTVEVAFHKNKFIYLKKPNGKTVKTRILRVEKL